MDGPWNDALPLVCLIHLPREDLLLPGHGVRLPRSGLTIREDRGAVAVDCGIYEFVDPALLIADLLAVSRADHVVELVALLRASESPHGYFCEMLRVFSFSALRQGWSARESYD